MNDPLKKHGTRKLLENIGLSPKEIDCYLELLHHGPVSISDLAKKASIERTSAYKIVSDLAEKGLLEQERTVEGRRVHAAPLSHLEELARDRQKSMTRARWKIVDLIPQIEAIRAHAEQAPSAVMGDVMIFRGDDALYELAERTLAIPNGSEICFINSHNYFHPPFNPTYDDEVYVPRRVEKNIKARLLYPVSEESPSIRKLDASLLRESRFLPANINFLCSVHIYPQGASFLWMKDQFIGLVINGGPIVDLMQAMFNLLWQMMGTYQEEGIDFYSV